MVRRGLHGEHADVLFEPALRIRTFLPEKRGAASDLNGYHIPRGRAVSFHTGARACPGCHLSRNHNLAAQNRFRRLVVNSGFMIVLLPTAYCMLPTLRRHSALARRRLTLSFFTQLEYYFYGVFGL